jgi:SH3 domain protein
MDTFKGVLRMKSMRIWVLIIAILSVFAATGFAETKFVSDSIPLSFRSGPSFENKILKYLMPGQVLELQKFGEKWSKVRLSDGKEGWVLSRYLADQPASRDVLARLRVKHQNLTEQAQQLSDANEKLEIENGKLMAAVSDHEKALEALRKDYQTLQSESAEFITLKKKHDEAASSLQERNNRLATLEEQVASMELNYTIKWFLAGSGVLVLGIIIGFISRRPRRRSSLL